jgi:pyrroline-5-carboxylate reductase
MAEALASGISASGVLASGSLGLLGCGNMGGAVARGVIAAKLLPPQRVRVYDTGTGAARALETLGCPPAASPQELLQLAEVIVLAIKPQIFQNLAEEWKKAFSSLKNKTIVSVMAGIKTARLREVFPDSFTVIRVMPNLGLSVGEGVTAIASDGIPETSLTLTEAIFNSCGKTVRVSEDQMDAVTGLSGSGPMYVFEFIEALTEAGMAEGLPRETAYQLALQTAKGSLKLLETSSDAPPVWSARVRSPGGTTAAAQKVLESEDFHAILKRAVKAAVARSKELSS